MISYRNLVAEFSEAMLAKLRQNRHKGDKWTSCEYEYFLYRLYEESRELQKAVERNADPEEVLEEAADVANFALMIAHKYGALGIEDHDRSRRTPSTRRSG